MAKLKIITMEDIPVTEVKWLWYPYIPYGKLTIIYGDPGDGKTIFPELDCLYNSDVFPMRDTVLYAEWESIGLVQDFEEYEYGFSGLGNDYEQYRPGVRGYNINYVHGGINSIHRKGETADDEDFLLFGDEIGYLIEGRTYEISFYVTTDQANAKSKLSLVQHNFTDLEDDIECCDLMDTVSLKQGEWTKVTYRFKDKGYYLRIRSSGNASLFFDDVLVVPLDNAGGINYNVPITGENADAVIASIVVMAASLFVLVLLQSKVIKTKSK